MSPEPALAGVQGRSAGLRRDVGRDRRRIRCHGRVRGCGADDGDVRGKRGVGDCVHGPRVRSPRGGGGGARWTASPDWG